MKGRGATRAGQASEGRYQERQGNTGGISAHLSVKWGIMTASSVRVPIVD